MYATGAAPTTAADVIYAALHNFVHAAGMDWCYFECGPNEPGDDATDWLDAYYAYLVPKLAADGIKNVAYNFSVCHPPLSHWARLSKSLKAIKSAGKNLSLVGLHQYGLRGSMQDDADTFDSARVLRHRCILELEGVPIVLTECGLDEPGWQQTDQGTDGYLADLKWLDYELKKDANVLGATIYTMDAEPGWEAYRIEGDLAKGLFDYITTQNATIVEVPGESLPPVKAWITARAGLNLRDSAGRLIATLPNAILVEKLETVKDRTCVRVTLEGSILSSGIKEI
jgi:hypothetical protein